MNLQPSLSISFNDRRSLFADELEFGGHGQVYLSGAGTFTPTTDKYVFYQIDFLTNSVLNSVVFRNVNLDNTVIYTADNSNYSGVSFLEGTTWYAPLTSITLDSGTAIAYQYRKFIPEELLVRCPNVIFPDEGYGFVYSDVGSQLFTDGVEPVQVPEGFLNS